MLKINNLDVEIEGKKIVENINLEFEKGKVYALMGPNGSGKSTLANALMGNPKYKITNGKIFINNEDITDINPDERAKKGIFMSFQYPQEIEGVSIYNFLKGAVNSLREEKMSFIKFRELIKEKSKELDIDEEFVSRYLNKGFSGGEKKKSEILQLLTLNPDIAILDETDSGLDIDSLKIVAEGVKKFMNENKTVLIITHYKRILEHIKPDKIFIMKQGKIVHEGGKEVADELEEKGYKLLK